MLIKPFYQLNCSNLSELNTNLLIAICNYLSIQTKISDSNSYKLIGEKSEKLLNICIESGATSYVSGPSAKEYLDTKIFEDNDIKVEWFNYSNYKPYPQLWGEFESGVSVLDLLFNCGANSKHYLFNARKFNSS